MSEERMQQIMDSMEPEEALAALGQAAGRLFPLLGDEALLKFVVNLVGKAGGDKVASMVHLWLAECLGEGVDPTQMCRSLLEKVTRAEELLKVAEPELLVLFEEWLEELAEEAAAVVREVGAGDPEAVARKLKIPPAGTAYLLDKLRREGRI